MNGLDDDDPTNDTWACRRLAISLFQANDVKRASAIVAVLFKTLEDYISEKQRDESAGEVAEEISERYDEGKELVVVEELAPGTALDIVIRDKETAATDENANAQATEASALQDTAQENRAFGPQNNLSRRPQSIQSGDERDDRQNVHPHNKLALHLDSDAWCYSCDGCGYDAEDKGNMYVFF